MEIADLHMALAAIENESIAMHDADTKSVEWMNTSGKIMRGIEERLNKLGNITAHLAEGEVLVFGSVGVSVNDGESSLVRVVSLNALLSRKSVADNKAVE